MSIADFRLPIADLRFAHVSSHRSLATAVAIPIGNRKLAIGNEKAPRQTTRGLPKPFRQSC